jgi:AMP nucleosidase
MVPKGVKTEASDRKVTDNFVQRHIETGVEALRLIRRHGKSVRHLHFEDGPGRRLASSRAGEMHPASGH